MKRSSMTVVMLSLALVFGGAALMGCAKNKTSQETHSQTSTETTETVVTGDSCK